MLYIFCHPEILQFFKSLTPIIKFTKLFKNSGVILDIAAKSYANEAKCIQWRQRRPLNRPLQLVAIFNMHIIIISILSSVLRYIFLRF